MKFAEDIHKMNFNDPMTFQLAPASGIDIYIYTVVYDQTSTKIVTFPSFIMFVVH